MLLNGQRAQSYISTDTSTVTPKTGHSSQPLSWTAQPLLAKVGISFKYPLKASLSSSPLLSAVADTTTANGIQCRECGSRDMAHQTTASQESRSNAQAGATASSQRAAALHVELLTTATHQDFAKSPSVLEGKRRWGSKQGLQRLTCKICSVDPPGYFSFISCWYHMRDSMWIRTDSSMEENPTWGGNNLIWWLS